MEGFFWIHCRPTVRGCAWQLTLHTHTHTPTHTHTHTHTHHHHHQWILRCQWGARQCKATYARRNLLRQQFMGNKVTDRVSTETTTVEPTIWPSQVYPPLNWTPVRESPRAPPPCSQSLWAPIHRATEVSKSRLTPSLPRPVKFPGRNWDARTDAPANCNFRSNNFYLQRFAFLWISFHMPVQRKNGKNEKKERKDKHTHTKPKA